MSTGRTRDGRYRAWSRMPLEAAASALTPTPRISAAVSAAAPASMSPATTEAPPEQRRRNRPADARTGPGDHRHRSVDLHGHMSTASSVPGGLRSAGSSMECGVQGVPLLNVEPMTGIEPAYSAWEADVLPLNYIGTVLQRIPRPAGPSIRPSPGAICRRGRNRRANPV